VWGLEKREKIKTSYAGSGTNHPLVGKSLGAAGRVDLAMLSAWGKDRWQVQSHSELHYHLPIIL
jgi:hypothetical protein